MSSQSPIASFSELALPQPLIQALETVGYESPSAIQALTIPHLLAGRDLLGQAQTGTGKTAAFALPLLARLDLALKTPQLMVLTPTRELAIQVAEAFQRYAANLPGFHVLPVYGGQDYRTQLRSLDRGVHVVVGTPGRIMDHMRRGSLKLTSLAALVLDEADEMLRMGFIDDVEWILEKTPPERQVALFSATMPEAIRRITHKYLREPAEVLAEVTQAAAATIRQRVWMVSGLHKLDALTRLLEVEPFEAIIVFVRTRIATAELAEKLSARGYACAALNGDIAQQQREKTVDALRKGRLDILVATDVAARGLDVERISHVINYDIPSDVEAYVHRIGRTGRAGRSGEAILFASNRERRLLRAIEKSTGKPIEKMDMPTVEDVADNRVKRFKGRISDTLAGEELAPFRAVVESYQQEYGVPVIEVAAALAVMAQGKQPLFVPDKARKTPERRQQEREKRRATAETSKQAVRGEQPPDKGMERYRIEVGHNHAAKPANIVGAIANEAEIESEYIGRVDIRDDHSLVDLPVGMPKEVFNHLKGVWVCGQRLAITKAGSRRARDHAGKAGGGGSSGPGKPRGKKRPAVAARKQRGKKN